MERYWSGDRACIACALAMGDGICGDAQERSEPRGLCGQAQKGGKRAWKDIERGGARGQIKLCWFHGKLRYGIERARGSFVWAAAGRRNLGRAARSGRREGHVSGCLRNE